MGNSKTSNGKLGLTFQDSREQPVHRWYPYVEGFSAKYVGDVFRQSGLPSNVYDPFGGAGTTQLVASTLGIPSFYSEINPFMDFVARTKVISAAWCRQNLALFRERALEYCSFLQRRVLDEIADAVTLDSYKAAFPGRDFFEERHLRDLLLARDLALEFASDLPELRDILLLACASNVVHSSHMTRRADLRRRRDDEYKTRVVDVPSFIRKTVQEMILDVETLPANMAATVKISDDCRETPITFENSIDLALTSPPYLNGTNYFRNTKLELWYLQFIDSEDDLSAFRRKAVCGGINNVSKDRPWQEFDVVEVSAKRLDECAADRRIPMLVRMYFSDMFDALRSVKRNLRDNGRFIFDIGDSKFYGVHIPTDRIILELARHAGFTVDHDRVLASRYSRDKTELVQVELTFRKPSRRLQRGQPLSRRTLRRRIETFANQLPFREFPYSSRAWGHPLHSLSSYQGKLKPSLAHWLIKGFVPPGSSVLDPLGGVGTIPFEAALQGCQAISNDKSPFAAVVAAGKLNPPTIEEVKESLSFVRERMDRVSLSLDDLASAEFGLNASVSDYYHPETLDEILRARRVFLEHGWGDRGQTFVWASLLHVLHGNRPYALSRTSHPITPFNPTGPATYKNVLQAIWDRAKRVLSTPLSEGFVPGRGLYGDFRELSSSIEPVDVIVTSPPFMGMRFDRPNWLRMWFCGWEESDFHRTSRGFLEREQTSSLSCYEDFFDTCRSCLIDSGLLIVHVGSGGKVDLAEGLRTLATSRDFALEGEVVEDVQDLERHGLTDKGLTKAHHLLFLRAR